jgi:peroxiredoxin
MPKVHAERLRQSPYSEVQMQSIVFRKFFGQAKRMQVFSTTIPAIMAIVISFISSSAFAADDSDSLRVRDRFEFIDIDGKTHSSDCRVDQCALVLVFVTTDCPIANSYQPLLAKLHHEFNDKGFQFILVQEGPSQSPAKLRQHAKEYGVVFPVVMDGDHAIARKFDAKKTPEAVVIGRNGRVVYQGRIDDLHQGFGKKRAAATREDLRIALNELDAGKSISFPKTEAVGCSISYAALNTKP